jgi:hypothetical protein
MKIDFNRCALPFLDNATYLSKKCYLFFKKTLLNKAPQAFGPSMYISIYRWAKRLGCSNEVDIPVILLYDGFAFENFIPWSAPPVYLIQYVNVVGLKYSGKADDVHPYVLSTSVIMVEGGDSTLFQARNYNFESCSGTEIVTTLVGGQVVLIGVRIASHDNSLVP